MRVFAVGERQGDCFAEEEHRNDKPKAQALNTSDSCVELGFLLDFEIVQLLGRAKHLVPGRVKVFPSPPQRQGYERNHPEKAITQAQWRRFQQCEQALRRRAHLGN